MFKTLLVANRGEIAVRIMKTARRMGIGTVAIYSDADRHAMHVRVADEAVFVGPADARHSYLSIERVIRAARDAGADAIHPGYGFLSENAAFAEACAGAGIVFVGPPASAIEAMGSKSRAKAIMEQAGVPVVPGYHGEMQDGPFLKRKAYEIGYPVLIKAVAGGGGKGMRRVDKALQFEEALAAARREAEASFGDDRVLVERYITRPRHVEIQVFSDGKGRTFSLFERDCSIQRRHQKIIEESPAPGMTDGVRQAMGEAAVKAADAVGYVGAGTVEFIAEAGEDGGTLDADRFYFMEMNTRLQVEHPVTEMVTGLDLVEWQLRVAAGEALPADTGLRGPKGHAVEARLYAEDPDNGFLPSSGRLAVLRLPKGARVDTGVEEGDVVSPHYDPMIAKVIVQGPDREASFAALRAALDEAVVIGPKTNLAFLRAAAGHPTILAGTHDTGIVDAAIDDLTGGSVSPQTIADAAAELLAGAHAAPSWDPWKVNDGFRLTGTAEQTVHLNVDGVRREAVVGAGQSVMVDGLKGRLGSERVIVRQGEAFAVEAGRAVGVSIDDPLERTVEDTGEAAAALAPMHGRLVHLFVKEGDVVEKDTPLFAVEAMKMEHTVKAGGPAIVSAVHYVVGEQVGEGAEVIALGSADETAPDAASAGAAGAQPEEAATETPAVAAPDAGEPAPSPPAADT